MNVLLLYPQYPDSFWSFRHALRFVSKRASVPPLGLITVSAMLPAAWKKRLVDMNIEPLKVADLVWADFVFISAMQIQKASVAQVLESCHSQSVKVVVGGPLFTQEYKQYSSVDHFILNEAEITLPRFLEDLNNGNPKRIYKAEQGEFADLSQSPVPDYHLLKQKAYASMSLQVSRGCPFACDFCEITSLLGRRVRMKSPTQVISELDQLYSLRWRGPVFIVDDNFIGRRKEVSRHLLPAIRSWMETHRHPFVFNTQASIDLADDPVLLSDMINAGFYSTFIGIETPSEESLQECHKSQNKNRDLLSSVHKIQQAGMQVSGGFIVGFDTDSPSIFQRQIDFIQKSGIVSAMVGLLNAPKNTRLYKRLQLEKRLSSVTTGNNTDFSMNFIPKMDTAELLAGYKTILQGIYAVKPYYQRIRQFFTNYRPLRGSCKIPGSNARAFLKTLVVIGAMKKGRLEFWKFILWTLLKKPALLKEAFMFTVYGYHFRRTFEI